VRESNQLAIIGEPSPVTMPPNHLFDPVLDDVVTPAQSDAQTAGRIVPVNVAEGGVPKLPVSEARLGSTGVRLARVITEGTMLTGDAARILHSRTAAE
jgi:hypothetical protein